MVAQEGVRRWFDASANTARLRTIPKGGLRHDERFCEAGHGHAGRIAKVYDDAQLPEPAKLQRKAEVIAQMRAHYANLKKSWGVGKSGYDDWFDEPINNAKLNTWPLITIWCRPSRLARSAKEGILENFT
jgi:predicted aminopeptidase